MDQMTQTKHARYHPSIQIPKFTYVLEVKEYVPSKKSYNSAEACADEGLSYGLAKYGQDKLINVYVLQNDKAFAAWKNTT